MNWFGLTLVYVFLMVAASIINKKTLQVGSVDPLIFGAFVQLTTGLICLGLALTEGFQFQFSMESVKLIAIMAITYLVGVSLYFTGLKEIDLSQETILSSTGSIWGLLLGALFLGEVFSGTKIIGVVLIFIASLVAFWERQVLHIGKYQKIILFSAPFYALGAMWDKQLNSYGSALSYLAISFTLVGIAMLLFYGKRTVTAFKESFRLAEFWKGTLVNGVFYALSFWALFTAYQKGGEVSRMFPMTLSTSVFVPILGILLLKEYNRWSQKVVSVVILTAGLWLVKG